MVELGYSLSCEELGPNALVENAQIAEAAGFTFSLISDHYHPWSNSQPSSPFVWSVVGGISRLLKRMQLGTGVTCPIMRISPAIIAQAAATAAVMMDGKFLLGLGTGEYLNEHITGMHWPPPWQRLEMLEEAIEVIRLLWKGGWQNYEGSYFSVDHARLFTLPAQPPPIIVGAAHLHAAELAGRCGDAIVSFEPNPELIKRFEESGGRGKPRFGQLTVCFAPDKDTAKKIAVDKWPNAGIGSPLLSDLPLPSHFDKVIELMRPELITADMTLGPNPDDHIKAINEYIDAGYDHVYVHQVGPEQRAFCEFYADKILPHFNVKQPVAQQADGAAIGTVE